MGHVWSEPESPTIDDVTFEKTEFDVDWSVFEKEAEQSSLSAEDFLPPPPPLPIFTNPVIGDQDDVFTKDDVFESKEDSLFGSLPSTPTDVTSLWDDLPGDASEAFKDMDLEPQTQRTITPSLLTSICDDINPHSNMLLEESRMTIRKTVVGADGVRETFTHAIEWSNQLLLFEPAELARSSPPPPPPPIPPPPEALNEEEEVASVESYSSDEENVFENENSGNMAKIEPTATARESTSRLLTSSTEDDTLSPVSNLQQFFSPFLNPAIGPLSSTDTLNAVDEEEDDSDSDSTLTRSPSGSSSSSTATSARDENPFYDDDIYDTGMVFINRVY